MPADELRTAITRFGSAVAAASPQPATYAPPDSSVGSAACAAFGSSASVFSSASTSRASVSRLRVCDSPPLLRLPLCLAQATSASEGASPVASSRASSAFSVSGSSPDSSVSKSAGSPSGSGSSATWDWAAGGSPSASCAEGSAQPPRALRPRLRFRCRQPRPDQRLLPQPPRHPRRRLHTPVAPPPEPQRLPRPRQHPHRRRTRRPHPRPHPLRRQPRTPRLPLKALRPPPLRALPRHLLLLRRPQLAASRSSALRRLASPSASGSAATSSATSSASAASSTAASWTSGAASCASTASSPSTAPTPPTASDSPTSAEGSSATASSGSARPLRLVQPRRQLLGLVLFLGFFATLHLRLLPLRSLRGIFDRGLVDLRRSLLRLDGVLTLDSTHTTDSLGLLEGSSARLFGRPRLFVGSGLSFARRLFGLSLVRFFGLGPISVSRTSAASAASSSSTAASCTSGAASCASAASSPSTAPTPPTPSALGLGLGLGFVASPRSR